MKKANSPIIAIACLLNAFLSPACGFLSPAFGLANAVEPLNPPATNMAPCVSWLSPLGKPRFVMLCIHGLGLYSRSYKNFGLRMARHGAAVYAIDVRGFGSWMKAAGHEEIDFDACLQDIKTTLVSLHKAHPGLPVFLVGESMGGAIALRAASMFPELIDGLISSVPAGERFHNKRTDLKVAMEMLKGPNKDFDIGKSIIQQASSEDIYSKTDKKVQVVNEKEVHDWEDDPLDRMNLSPKDLMQFQRFMNDNYDSAKNISKTPVLFFQGIDDHLVRPDGTWELFKQLGTNDRTMVALPSRHLIFEQAQDTNQDLNIESTHLIMGWVLSKILTPTSVIATTDSAPAPTAAEQKLNNAIEKIALGQYSPATGLLQLLTTQPNNADAHYWLGMAYLKEHKPFQARSECLTAMRLGRGNGHSKQANALLLTLGDSQARTGRSAAANKPRQTDRRNAGKIANSTELGRTIAQGKPSVLLFYAAWCDQCDRLDTLVSQGHQMFGEKVNFIKVDVDQRANDGTIQTFSVGPIPTIVFLNRDGSIDSTLIGESRFVNVAKGVAKILH